MAHQPKLGNSQFCVFDDLHIVSLQVEHPHDDSKDGAAISQDLCAEDLHLLCDLFYLPYEHGSQG